MKNSNLIALLTDFGLNDHYVASVKGVIHTINPEVTITDICHLIKPQAVQEGAFLLKEVYPHFPKNTIFVAVVDPGVGSSRKALCIKTSRGYLIGPDNGLLSLALAQETDFVVREIQNDKFFRKPVSSTFHARDIFGPTAAWLSKENVFTELGPIVKTIHQFSISEPTVGQSEVSGQIAYIDRFGNALTSIQKKMTKSLKKKQNEDLCVKVRSVVLKKICSFFSEGEAGKLMAVWNSSDVLELAIPNGDAAAKFGLQVGDKVKIS